MSNDSDTDSGFSFKPDLRDPVSLNPCACLHGSVRCHYQTFYLVYVYTLSRFNVSQTHLLMNC